VLMSGVLQGSWNLGFLLASIAYGALFDLIGWRGLFWIGILPALAIVYIRAFVKEPEVWVDQCPLRDPPAEGSALHPVPGRTAGCHDEPARIDLQRDRRLSDHIGRRWSAIIPGLLTIPVAMQYLLSGDVHVVVGGFILQGAFGRAIYWLNPI